MQGTIGAEGCVRHAPKPDARFTAMLGPKCFHRFAARLLLATFGLPALPGLAAEDSPKPNPEEFSRVPGVFDVDLPKTVERSRVKLLFRPHFGDLIHRDYIRLPVGARLGLNDRTEVNGEAEAFASHGLKQGGSGYGIGALRLGTKYQWAHWLKPDIHASSGLNVSTAVGRPPVTMTDGQFHISPYLTFSRRSERFPKATPFLTLGTDLLSRTRVAGSFARNQPRSDTAGGSMGFLYDQRETLKYTVVANYATTSLIGRGSHHYASLSPGLLWQLPRALTFGSRTRWIFGVGCKVGVGPDGTEFGTSAKLRGELNLRRFFVPRSAGSD
jgi:hypothetical protein